MINEIVAFAMQDYPINLPYDEAEEAGVTVEELLNFFDVDEYFEYSTTNILAMEYIAEKVTGESMQDLVSSLVTSPLGLDNTVLPPRDAPVGVLPEPDSHTYFGKSCVDEINGSGGNASVGDRDDAFVDSVVNFGSGGSMYSTIVDLLQWSKSGLGDSLLSADMVKERHAFKPTSIILHYGLGMHQWSLFADPLPSDHDPNMINGWFGHGGDAFGSNSRSFKHDGLGTAFASAVNSCNYGHLNAVGFDILVKDYTSDEAGIVEVSTTPPTPSSGGTTSNETGTVEVSTPPPTPSSGGTTSDKTGTVEVSTTPPTPSSGETRIQPTTLFWFSLCAMLLF